MQMDDQAVESRRSAENIQVKTNMKRRTTIIVSIALSMIITLVVVAGHAPTGYVQNDWTEPFPAFGISGNLYYVGTRGLASYLITTPEGHILINSDLENTVPMIEASIAKLGFKFGDVKILLVSHAHWDHNAGSALIKERTGAKYMVMEPDVAVTEDGGKSDFQYGKSPESQYRPT